MPRRDRNRGMSGKRNPGPAAPCPSPHRGRCLAPAWRIGIVLAALIGLSCGDSTDGLAQQQGQAQGQGQGLGLMVGAGDGPIEIDAHDGIEWNRNRRTYTATGKAQAKRGDVTLHADKLVALYRENVDGGTDIYQLEAHNNVRIVSPTEQAQGDKAVYNVDKGVLVMSGRNLRLTTQTDLITARDTLEYWERQKLAVANGQAYAKRDTQVITADRLVAHLRDSSTGDLAIYKLTANGNVCIENGRDVARGQSGTYTVDTSIAVLVGDVRIAQRQNLLRGQRAVVNMKTGISRLEGRVKGTGRSGNQEQDRSPSFPLGRCR